MIKREYIYLFVIAVIAVVALVSSMQHESVAIEYELEKARYERERREYHKFYTDYFELYDSIDVVRDENNSTELRISSDSLKRIWTERFSNH